MKTLRHSLTVIALMTFSYSSFSQESKLLDSLPTTKEDFVKSEKNVIATIDWLEDTPLDQQVEKRKQLYALLLAWITNSPTVTIEISYDVITFTDKNKDLLMIFMGGWTKYSLNNSNSKDKLKGNVAGIKSAIKVYKTGKGIKKDKAMEKLIQLEGQGELENWVSDQLKKNTE